MSTLIIAWKSTQKTKLNKIDIGHKKPSYNLFNEVFLSCSWHFRHWVIPYVFSASNHMISSAIKDKLDKW